MPPRYRIEFRGYPSIWKGLPLSGYQRWFYLRYKQNTSLAMSIEIDKGEWRRRLHSHKFDEGILF